MSMVCPEFCIESIKSKPYDELIEIRNDLVRKIRRFERAEFEGKGQHDGASMLPSPSTRYQWDLQCLSLLCSAMQERYCDEFVWKVYD